MRWLLALVALSALGLSGYAVYRVVRHEFFPQHGPPAVQITYGCEYRPWGMGIPQHPLVAFGDSITWGQGTSLNCLPLDNRPILPLGRHRGSANDTSYPADLARLLGRAVLNYGQRGERTDQGAHRLAALLRVVQPSAVLVMEGTNDVLQGRSLKTTQAYARSMLEMIRARGVQPILLIPPPLYGPPGYPPQSPQRLQQLAGQLWQMARTMGVPVVDVAHAFAANGGEARLIRHADGADDHIHPNDAGYRLIARLAERLLSQR